MYDYDTTGRLVPVEDEKMLKEMPISAMVDAATSLSDDALKMTCQLKSHLFGTGNADDSVAVKPMCLKDVLDMHVSTMEKVCGNLAEIMKGMGI